MDTAGTNQCTPIIHIQDPWIGRPNNPEKERSGVVIWLEIFQYIVIFIQRKTKNGIQFFENKIREF
jgi:hypothetical protein